MKVWMKDAVSRKERMKGLDHVNRFPTLDMFAEIIIGAVFGMFFYGFTVLLHGIR